MEVSEKKENSSVNNVIKTLMEKNPEGGEINMTVLEKQLPGLTRTEIIQELRKSNSGAFVTGRRGKPSRFVYGTQAIPHLHQQHISPTRREVEHSENSQGIELRLNIGGTITTIPIKLELGVAA